MIITCISLVQLSVVPLLIFNASLDCLFELWQLILFQKKSHLLKYCFSIQLLVQDDKNQTS